VLENFPLGLLKLYAKSAVCCHATYKRLFLLGLQLGSELATTSFLVFTLWLNTDDFPLWQDSNENAFLARKKNQQCWVLVLL